MARILQVVERNKAGLGYRFANYCIDFILSIFIMWLLIAIVLVILYVVKGTEIGESLNDLGNLDPLMDRIFTILMYALIMFLTEKLTGGRSLGKLITGTKVVKSDGSDLTTDDLLKRNFSRAVPFDPLSFFGNNGWHDRWSDTRVVRLKNFENAKNLESDLQNIGKKEILE